MRWKRIWLQGGAWLLLLLLSRALGLPLGIVLGVLAVWLASALVFSYLRPSRRTPAVGGTVQGTVEPPTARHAYKPPTTLAALVQALEDAGLGAVRAEGTQVTVSLPGGEWAAVVASEAGHVTQGTISLTGSSVQALALACDAMARELGTMRLRAAGAAVEIDGTRPRAMLLSDVAAALDAERLRARAERRRLERERDRRDEGGRYLN